MDRFWWHWEPLQFWETMWMPWLMYRTVRFSMVGTDCFCTIWTQNTQSCMGMHGSPGLDWAMSHAPIAQCRVLAQSQVAGLQQVSLNITSNCLAASTLDSVRRICQLEATNLKTLLKNRSTFLSMSWFCNYYRTCMSYLTGSSSRSESQGLPSHFSFISEGNTSSATALHFCGPALWETLFSFKELICQSLPWSLLPGMLAGSFHVFSVSSTYQQLSYSFTLNQWFFLNNNNLCLIASIIFAFWPASKWYVAYIKMGPAVGINQWSCPPQWEESWCQD